MKIFFLCNKSPYPPGEGGPLAINANIQSLLKGGHQVKVLALNTNKYRTDPASIPQDFRNQTKIEFVYVDLSIKPMDAFLNLFSSKSYHVERFISKDVSNKIREILKKEKFDIVQLEMLYMTPYIDTIRKYSEAPIVMRSHNIEHKIWERVASITKNPLKKLYLKYLAKKLKNFELGHLDYYDGLMTISPFDAKFFKSFNKTTPIDYVPFGINMEEYPIHSSGSEFPSLFHLGSMNWMPNEEGIKWFVQKTWPLLSKKFPELKLHLAGREMPQWLQSLNEPGIVVHGEVESARDFILSKGIMVVPLFSGSGIRIKIIEGMALGKTIISTTIGAEGINYKNGENILIANTPEEFSDAVRTCMTDRTHCAEIGKNARQLIEREHSLDHVLFKLEEFYSRLLN
ncbi:MAG: glycosyltransferase family 4 protein [Bacteroidales bacterium]|nr:glycosyltransferase family 4 protein [Bacteroidales bacterium]MCF8403320.1 glycosyltransferase family 4 protein [Bacteroidales bacterium]